MNRGLTGSYRTVTQVGDEPVQAFVPHPLPPNPPLTLDSGLRESVDQALLELGRLDGVSSLLPDKDLFLYSYVRKEAVLSSQIEGTPSSLSDLLLFELGAVATARALMELFDHDRELVQALGRSGGSAAQVHQELMRRPLATVRSLVPKSGLSAPIFGGSQRGNRARMTEHITSR